MPGPNGREARMTKTGASVGLVFAIAAAFGLSGTATRAAKPTVDPDWSCAITFADRPGDVIHSDGNNGISTYTAGVDLVTCYIHPDGTAALAQNLHFQTGVDRRGVGRRTLHIEGQTYGSASYASDDTVVPDYFEVWRL